MKRALLLLLLLPGLALAHTFTFTWTDPSTRIDGSALNPATELKSYRMQCSGPENAERIVDRAATTPAVSNGSRELYASSGVMQFDGVTDVVNTGFALSNLAGSSFTIEAIVRYAGTADRIWVPIFGANSEVNRLFIGKDSGDALAVWINGFGSYTVTGHALFDGQDRHLAIVFDDDANELRVFVDRVLVSTEAGGSGSIAETNNLLIGGVGHDVNQRWIGTVRDVIVSASTTAASTTKRQYVWTDAVQADGAYACRMTASDTGDRESVWSHTASVVKVAPPVIPAAPSAPTDLRGQ